MRSKMSSRNLRRRRHRSLENYIDRQRILEVGIDRLSTAVSTGFARSKVRKAPRPKEAKGKIRTDVQVAEEASMAVTYCVARPFIRTEDGAAPGEAQDART